MSTRLRRTTARRASTKKPRIGITLGDCAGIGPEIVEIALKSDRLERAADYKIIGQYPDCMPGHSTRETACAAAVALEEAVTLARRGELDAIVTGPVDKARMYDAGFKFSGQTEFFAERCGVKNFAMCLTGGKLMRRMQFIRDHSCRALLEIDDVCSPSCAQCQGRKMASAASCFHHLGSPRSAVTRRIDQLCGRWIVIRRREVLIGKYLPNTAW